MILKYTIPGNPVTKKNSQRIIRLGNGRTIIKPSAQYDAYENQAAYFIQPKPEAPIDYPVNCRYTYFMETRRKVDALNLCEATDDILVLCGVLKDDNRDVVAAHDGTRVYYDKEYPRVEILITPIQESYGQWSLKTTGTVKPEKKPVLEEFDEEHWD